MLSIHTRKFSPELPTIDENEPLASAGGTRAGSTRKSRFAGHARPHVAFVEKEYLRWLTAISDEEVLLKLRFRQGKQYKQDPGNAAAAPEPGRSPGKMYEKAYGTAENIRRTIETVSSGLLRDEYLHAPGFRVIKITYKTRTSTLCAVVAVDNVKILDESQIREKLAIRLRQFTELDHPGMKIKVRITHNPPGDTKDAHRVSPGIANPTLEDAKTSLQESLVEPFYKNTVNVGSDYGPGIIPDIPLKELVHIRLRVDRNTLHCDFLPRRQLFGETRRRLDVQTGKLKAVIAAAIEPLLVGDPSLGFKAGFNGTGPYVVQLAGHASGDMYNVAASLLLNPTRSVVISRFDPDFTHPDPARNANMKVYDQSETISAFLRHTLPVNEHWRVSRIPVRGMKENAERKRLKRLSPGIPVDLEKSMAQVARVWGPQYCNRLCRQWGLRPGDDDRAQSYDKELELWLQLHGLSLDDLKRERIIVLWSRFSGKKGDLHPEHDTSFEGMRQLVDMARELADVVIITGDKPLTDGMEGRQLVRRKNKYKLLETEDDAAVSGAPVKVLDLTEFWNDQTTRTWCMPGKRTQQFRLYDYLHRIGEVKHLGMRSGILLAAALLGYDTYYMEEPHSVGSKRMGKFERKLSNLSRIRIDNPPTRTGKAIKELQHKHWSSLSGTTGRSTDELAGSGTSPSYLSNIKYTPTARRRGLRLEIIDPRDGQHVERSDLKEKPDVTGFIKGFTKPELDAIKIHLAWK